MNKQLYSSRSLWLATLAAMGASACCVAPLLLLTMGIGGAWLSHLTAMEPLRPLLSVITVLLLLWAYQKLYFSPVCCSDEQICARPEVARNQRIIFWGLSVFLLGLLALPYYANYLID